jgi:hypothetical protein
MLAHRVGSRHHDHNSTYTHPRMRANKGAAGNAVGRLAVCEVKLFGDRTVTPPANCFAGRSRASASLSAFKVLLRSAPPRARA